MFSAQPGYNDWFISFYNVAFTSLPVIALGVFDKDVSSRVCLEVHNLLPGLCSHNVHLALRQSWFGICAESLAYFRSLHYIKMA